MIELQDIINGVLEIVPKYSVKSVGLFGSYAQNKHTEKSDVDLLIEFASPAVSLLMIFALKYDLEERLGVNVDVIHGPLAPNSMIILDKVVPIYEQ